MKKQKKKIENKTKKALPKALKITFGLLLCFVLLGGIGIGIYYLIKAITVRWFIFVALIPIIPFGIANLKRLVFRKGKYTVEQNKQANVKVCIYTLFYWLCDLFYMSFLIDSLALKFIFGGLIMLIIFMNVVKAFTFPKDRTGFESWGLLQDFLVGIGLSIYLIYIIPDADVKEVLIPVIAAVYGGLITLVGVAWTIRKGEENRKKDRNQLELDRKEEERKKVIPFVTLTKNFSSSKSLKIKYSCLDNYERICKKTKCYGIEVKNFAIKNISSIPFIIKAISLNGMLLEYEPAFVLEKNGEITLEVTGNRIVKSEEMLKDLCLILYDVFENKYQVQCVLSYKAAEFCFEDMYPFIYTVEQVTFPVLLKDKIVKEKVVEVSENA